MNKGKTSLMSTKYLEGAYVALHAKQGTLSHKVTA